MSAAPERLSAALADRYRIERELGAGGMATVYLAHDLKHDRHVALKVLKPELAAVLGAERFVVEIRTTAALQHPHILPLFDSGTADGFLYYVMPFVEGETLRQKLDRETHLGIDEAVKIAVAVADALDYAHRHGVIHRDIKPENILLQEGRPMVADFGIALAVSAAAGGRMTETGLSLGTPHYMSPEQATAEKEITARSDVYSLGSVLYEMLTGSPPHVGASAQQIIMKIVTEEAAPVSRFRKSVPRNVADAVARSLEKLPADRFESAKAFGEALTNPGFTVAGAAATGRASEGASWKRRARAVGSTGILLFAGVAAGVAAGVSMRGNRAPADLSPMHLRLPLPPGDSISVSDGERSLNAARPSRTAFVFSPDGRSLVYAGMRGGHRQLFLRSLDGETATPIGGTENGESPFFSPDGASLGYWAAGHLRRVALAGGPPSDIVEMNEIAGASWGDDDRIVVGQPSVGLVMLSMSGKTASQVIVKRGARLPQFLPGQNSILFTYQPGSVAHPRLEVISLASGARKILVDSAEDGRYVSSGQLVFGRDGAMLAAPLDLERLELTATPVVVLDDVMQALNGRSIHVLTGAMQVAISTTGQLAWLTGGLTPDRRATIESVDRQGRVTRVASAGEAAYLGVRLSRDETSFATFVLGRAPRIAIVDLAREGIQSLPSEGPPWILWSRDGTRVVHGGMIGDSSSFVWSLADGSRAAEPMAGTARVAADGAPAFWSADGAELFWIGDGGLRGTTLANGVTRIVAGLPASVRWPTLSPNGKWLAYAAQEAGSIRFEVFVQPWPALDRRWKISPTGGHSPAWTKAGHELLYQHTTSSDVQLTGGPPLMNEMMAVAVTDSPRFSAGVPRPLFTGMAGWTTPIRGWDVTADGSRFLTLGSAAVPSPAGEIHMVANWFPELKRLTSRRSTRP